jgi:DNA replication protein DnaC
MTLSGDRSRWDAFNWDRHPALRTAKRSIVDWYNGLPDSGALVLAGNYGSGKSHIAEAIYDLYGYWRTSLYEEVALCKAIQRTYDDRSMTEDGLIRQALFRPELFILDDLGTYETNNRAWLLNVYQRIFADYMTVQKKPILVTTNLPLMKKGVFDVRERIGGRSFSRLCAALHRGAVIDLFAVPDIRIEQYLARYKRRRG